MSIHRWVRKVHYWATAVFAIPLLVIVCSGLLLQVKKQWSWVQPTEMRGSGESPQVDFEAVLAAARSVTDAQVSGWNDVRRIDVRPDRGLAKVWTRSGIEVQVDLSNGQVLAHAERRSDWIESIHDGSYFGGDVVKLGVFLTTGIGLLGMWCTGVWMFVWPFLARRRA